MCKRFTTLETRPAAPPLGTQQGILVGLATAGLFSIMAVSSRLAAAHGASALLIATFRPMFGLCITSLRLLRLGAAGRRACWQGARGSYTLLALRAPTGVLGGGSAFWVYAQGVLTLGDIAALFQTIPLCTMLLACLLLAQRPRLAQFVAAIVAVPGVLLISQSSSSAPSPAAPPVPNSSAQGARFEFALIAPTNTNASLLSADPSALLSAAAVSMPVVSPTAADQHRHLVLLNVVVVLGGAMAAAFGFTTVQVLSKRGVSKLVQVHMNMLGQTLLLLLLAAAMGFREHLLSCHEPRAWVALLGVGLSSLLGQFGAALAISLAGSTSFAITQELDVVLNFVWDAALWHRQLTLYSLCGSTLVCAGALILTLCDRQAQESNGVAAAEEEEGEEASLRDARPRHARVASDSVELSEASCVKPLRSQPGADGLQPCRARDYERDHAVPA